MARVLKRTGNSVTVQIKAHNDYTEWQEITVGGSVIFKWKVKVISTPVTFGNHKNYYYFTTFSKKIPSDKVNYIVTYTHWKSMGKMGTAVLRVRTDHFEAVYFPGTLEEDYKKEVTVEISTDQLRPCVFICDDTDFMLRGEDGSVSFHKIVLAVHSSVFKTMLAGSEGVIDVPGMSKEMLQHLKMYMYLGKLPEKQNEQVDCVKQLLLLSSCYLIEDLKLRCVKELRFLLTPENVANMIHFAAENKIQHLFVEILDCAAMGDIDTNEVRRLIEANGETSLGIDSPIDT